MCYQNLISPSLELLSQQLEQKNEKKQSNILLIKTFRVLLGYNRFRIYYIMSYTK